MTLHELGQGGHYFIGTRPADTAALVRACLAPSRRTGTRRTRVTTIDTRTLPADYRRVAATGVKFGLRHVR
ncbi:hypothetical protein STENM327S_00358 [Streptomyces tendae]